MTYCYKHIVVPMHRVKINVTTNGKSFGLPSARVWVVTKCLENGHSIFEVTTISSLPSYDLDVVGSNLLMIFTFLSFI